MEIPVTAIGAITIAIGVFENYLVEIADKKLGKMLTGDEKNTDGISSVVAPLIRKYSESLKKSWAELMEKFPSDYKEIFF